MPVIRVTLIEGYPDEARLRLGEALTAAVRTTIAAPLDGITVAIEELKPSNYMRGGQSRTPGKALTDPASRIREFLETMEARDLDKAKTFLAPDFRMTFPGGVEFGRLEELIAWAGPRYNFMRKTYERFDTCSGDEGAIVYCHGTLSGEWPDGSAFSDIRFIDRFEFSGDLISRQQVWNDLAESVKD
ncbi:tautomerase family protein [Roseibium aggregatum]|uniref:Tautomerase family protein n=1 Tax=Roseibium aggregatum TaxID=187304 RepID=A0A939EHF9_9HYPH|nr:tautomerase family protein [Roseibium aggregatum]MBN9672532.1 tautomerase family protein [Roseibium aggregatum]